MRLAPLSSAALLFLSACGTSMLSRPTDDLSIRTPGSWEAVETGSQRKISTGWLASFNDPTLTKTVDSALQHNRGLKIAAARMREAKESSIRTRSNLLPTIQAGGNASATDTSGASLAENYRLSLAASWEPDLWGRLRDLTRAADADEQAAIEDFRGARLSLAANTAKSWCNLVSANQELELAKVTLNSFEKNLRIIERNYRGTGEGALDIQFGRTNVSSAQRALEQRRVERDQAARTLELLLGQYPGATIQARDRLPTLPPHVAVGIPADLLDRRPDLAASRARLFASANRADAARKALLPSFSLTGNAGSSTASLGRILSTDQLATTIATGFTQLLTDGGATRAEARAALARNEASLHSYVQTALEAFREVEAALAADRSLAKQEAFLAVEVEQATLAERQAERDYSEGINPNILSVLEAQRRANNARASVIRLNNQRLQNRIDLHLALGGDFYTSLSK